MKFKIGFEFQEGNNLCRQSFNSGELDAFNKKEIFSVVHQEKGEVWHVEFDDEDIEFVTQPFEHEKENNKIGFCFDSFEIAWKNLVDILRKESKTTIDNWVNIISKELENKNFILVKKEIYDETKNFDLIYDHSGRYDMSFQPQVTVQAAFSYVIPLYFGLFGALTTDGYYTPKTSIFFRSLAYYNEIKDKKSEEQTKAIITDSINGFLLLFMVSIVGPCYFIEENMKHYMEDLAKDSAKNEQIDAKQLIFLMSRLPFSFMWQSLWQRSTYLYPGNLRDLIDIRMINGNENFKKKEIVNNFRRIQYGEYYYNPDVKNKKLDLTYLYNYFDEKFRQAYEVNLKEILEAGALSTVMINNMNENIRLSLSLNSIPSVKNPGNILDIYYDRLISSVENPYSRFEFISSKDDNPPELKERLIEYDSFSPPWFLSNKDSMGRLKDFKNIDLEYGSSVTELRSIRNVNKFFYTTYVGDSEYDAGEFLAAPFEENGSFKKFTDQVNGLLNFLSNIDSELSLKSVIEYMHNVI